MNAQILIENGFKAGVYIDSENIIRCGGHRMQYDVLREFICRDGACPIHMNTYVAFDTDRSKRDVKYSQGVGRFFSVVREFGFKVITKEVRWFTDEEGKTYGKANADMDMAVDALLQGRNLDKVILVTGDGDFVQVIRALQSSGCRVEVVGFQNVSRELRNEADKYFSGFLVPNLLPCEKSQAAWGEIDSKVRGYCYHYEESKGYGFLRFMKSISPGLWVTDSRNPDSPYGSAFFHVTALPEGIYPQNLPSADIIFEFQLAQTKGDGKLSAVDLKVVS